MKFLKFFLALSFCGVLTGCFNLGKNNSEVKEVEIFGISTATTAAQFTSKFPNAKCSEGESFPPYSKEFDPIGFEMKSRTMSDAKWKEKGVFVKVKTCTLEPDEFTANPAHVTFYNEKIVNIYRNYKGIKQLMVPLIDTLRERVGSKPKTKEYNDGGFIGYLATFSLGQTAELTIESFEWGDMNGSYISEAQGTLNHKPTVNDYCVERVQYKTEVLNEEFRKLIKSGLSAPQKTNI